jgi:hypothetical protein
MEMNLKFLTLAAFILLGNISVTHAQDPRIKSWKTLTNENGFEFKYPDCWVVKPDNPDEMDKTTTSAHFVVVEETKSCARPLLNPPHQNLVGFNGGIVKSTPKEALKEISILERNSKNKIARQEWLFFKHLKVGSDDAIVIITLNKDVKFTTIGWGMTLYCPMTQVSFGGPGIKDPDPSYFEKFKAGDMAMPEPEKTIFESIRCVKPKVK